jgi:transcriptional regulator with XRE-family HTH domain
MEEEKVIKMILFSCEKKLIGDRLAQICKEREIKHKDLCCRAIVNKGEFSRIINGTQNFCIDTLLCILSELEMSLFEFFDCDTLRHVVIRIKSVRAPEKGIKA